MDGRPIRKEKFAFSNLSGYVWTGSKRGTQGWLVAPGSDH